MLLTCASPPAVCVCCPCTGIYSWNWELPLNHQQVLNCHKTPPPELTRQQEALAAATAAAAAAAAVTAGATPDTIPNLPVVARMASLLGKRQHQQMAPMSSMSMGPPPMMFAPMAMDMSGMEGAAGSVATSAAAAAAAPAGTAVESTVEATAEDRVRAGSDGERVGIRLYAVQQSHWVNRFTCCYALRA